MSNEPSNEEKFDWALRHIVPYACQKNPKEAEEILKSLEDLYGE